MSKILTILKRTKAITTDSHIVLTSGKHSSKYLNKDALYPHTKEVSRVGKMIAQKYKDKEIDAVIGPAMGGIILSQWTAYHLTKLKRKEILGGYSEKDEQNNQIFRRGYDQLVKNRKVLVVEDFTTTGGSVKKTVDSVKALGGEVVGVCVMVNRDPKNVTAKVIGAPFTSLGIFSADAYEEKFCPMCKAKMPVNTTLGHGREYLKKKAGK
ncbi:MAG: phosphoribosyltransferase family protein [Candidatus Beckwithbacteria bacterium]|nr:phosphoribosyltransferase family protein [Candidatus Beckwithbacteria bacterium]